MILHSSNVFGIVLTKFARTNFLKDITTGHERYPTYPTDSVRDTLNGQDRGVCRATMIDTSK